MPLYRCQNQKCTIDPHGRLIFDFEAAEPVCPKCKSDMRKPEHKFRIVKRAVIHFHIIDPKGPDAGFGDRRRIACEPKGSIAGKHATGLAAAVTCPACLKSPEWIASAAENDFAVPAENDYTMELDPTTGEFATIPPYNPPPEATKAGDCGCGK